MSRHLFLWVWNLAGGDLHAFPRWLVPVEWTDPLVSWVWYGLSRFYNTDELPWVVNLFAFWLSIFDVLAPIILCGLLGSAVGALVTGLTGPEIATKATPNQGIRESAYNSAKFAVAGAVLGGAIILTGHSLSGYSGGIMYDLIMGATIGAIASGFVPALACIQHYAIRLILVVQGKAPWSYGRFLICCRERMILQQVGGRFSFFHVLLQVYFMEMKAYDVDKPESERRW